MAQSETLHMKEFRIVEYQSSLIGNSKKAKCVRGEPSDVLPTVNQWLAESGCRVVSIESLYDSANSRSTDSVHDFHGIRVWFTTSDEDEKLNVGSASPILVQRKSR